MNPRDSDADGGEPLRVGSFKFYLDDRRWEWSDAVARMHGYSPGTVTPTTELLLHHKHPDDKSTVAALFNEVTRNGAPFSSRHRIIDTDGRTRRVIVVGDRAVDSAGQIVGTGGFYIDVTDSQRADEQAVMDSVVHEFTESRATIERAKGVLMLAYGINAERAFDVLVWRSQDANIKLRELAHQLLHAITDVELPVTVREQIDHLLLTLPH
ncbi:PAS and ANTAR domain-containing protein [Antrihabitans sp. YC2-6]|uniref:PAS and ANTAR domain-containing protein n=1 Tax=Antrihabitans sp. YC2-6 TaxID=2799498 RepID=UPI0027DB444B|nr:PAS and ANTAR domain-containing protein [Antrihabitans sp. YC2-6]